MEYHAEWCALDSPDSSKNIVYIGIAVSASKQLAVGLADNQKAVGKDCPYWA